MTNEEPPKVTMTGEDVVEAAKKALDRSNFIQTPLEGPEPTATDSAAGRVEEGGLSHGDAAEVAEAVKAGNAQDLLPRDEAMEKMYGGDARVYTQGDRQLTPPIGLADTSTGDPTRFGRQLGSEELSDGNPDLKSRGGQFPLSDANASTLPKGALARAIESQGNPNVLPPGSSPDLSSESTTTTYPYGTVSTTPVPTTPVPTTTPETLTTPTETTMWPTTVPPETTSVSTIKGGNPPHNMPTPYPTN